MALMFLSAIAAATPQPAQAATSMAAGINYLSSGNAWAESSATLSADFARFAGDNIRYINIRIMWSVMEPSRGYLSTTELSNVKRVLTTADKYGIHVGITFWTDFTSKLGLPHWVSSYYSLKTEPTQGYYVWYLKAVVAQLKNYHAVDSWAILNEPWKYPWSTTDKNQFQTLFKNCVTAVKLVDPNHPVIARFCLNYTPANGMYDQSVYGMFDAFAITEYLDPSNPNSRRCNENWNQWNTLVSQLKAIGKPLWVIEFGFSDRWGSQSTISTWYQQSLTKFAATGIVQRAYAWAWQTRSASDEAFNIYSGHSPYPSYYQLAKY